MSPAEAIAALDRALAETGEDVILRRVTGTGANTANADVTCRAFVRSWRLREQPLVGTLAQFDFVVTMSPTEISRAKWPGTGLVSTTTRPDPSIPRKNDKIIIKGTTRNIEAVEPIEMNGTLVRFDIMTLG